MKNTTYKITIVAVAAIINIIGDQLALLLRLPVYLDCIGTVICAALLGPLWGMLPNAISGIIMGFAVDIYALYYAPVGLLFGFITGLLCMHGIPKKFKVIPVALLITLPTSIFTAAITAYIFGGITSAGSTVLIQALAKTNFSLIQSCFIVQFATDFVDRVIALLIAGKAVDLIPSDVKDNVAMR